MTRLNLEFIGEIVSSPNGKSSWSGTTFTFWGKFKETEKPYGKFTRENLIEAIPFSEKRPSKEYYLCTAFQTIPDKYKYEVIENA